MEALVEWTDPPADASEPRVERAWELTDAIADTHGLSHGEFVQQVDKDWSGPGN